MRNTLGACLLSTVGVLAAACAIPPAALAFEGSEGVHLALTGPSGGAVLGDPTVAQLVIHDEETPDVAIEEVPT